jgi:hypothetical protein
MMLKKGEAMWLRGQQLKKNKNPSVGYCVAVGGLITSGLAVVVLHGVARFGWEVEMFLGAAMLVVFQICALASCLVERKTNHRKVGLALSSAIIVLAAAGVIRGVMQGQHWAGIVLRGLVVPIIVIGIVAAAVTVKSQSHPRQRPWKTMLAIWLIPAAWQMILFYADTLSIGSKMTAAAAVLFGPWATQVARIGNWPNAGEFFLFWPAMLMSILLAVVVFGMLRGKNRFVAGVFPSAYASVIVLWEILGIIQLVNCAE